MVVIWEDGVNLDRKKGAKWIYSAEVRVGEFFVDDFGKLYLKLDREWRVYSFDEKKITNIGNIPVVPVICHNIIKGPWNMMSKKEENRNENC